jgi:uncharacterized protein YdaU (DUF1376 family)
MKSPAFQLYAADFYMDTVGWTCEEIGVYFRLLMAEWVNGELPNDELRLAKTCQMSVKKFHHNFKNVSPKFIQNGRGYLINPRLEATREKQNKYIESQINRANKRWDRVDAVAYPPALPTHMPKPCSSTSSSTSINKDKHKDIVIPTWIKKETWDAFLEIRKSKGAKNTDIAIKLLISKIGKLRADGHDVDDVLKESIMNGWKGVFPLKTGGKDGRGNDSKGGFRIPEYKGEHAELSPEERAKNVERIRQLAGAIGAGIVPGEV